MTDGVLLRETLKDADLDKYRYELVGLQSCTDYLFCFLYVVTMYIDINCFFMELQCRCNG